MTTEPKDQRIPVMMTGSEVAAIDEWRFANRAPSRSDSIRQLVRLGIAASPQTKASGPLLGPEVADRALRDLMPLIEILTDYDLRASNGLSLSQTEPLLDAAIKAFRAIPADSPAIAAYMGWLEQNTQAEDQAR